MLINLPSSFRCAALPRAILVAGLGCSVVAVPAMVQAASTTQQARNQVDLAIPAGSLDQVLNRFAAATGILLAIDGALTGGRQSPGLTGRFGVTDGLAAILAGTGLEAVAQGENRYALKRADAGAIMLSPISVTAAGQSPGTTEGSGSYGTDTMSTANRLNLSLRETPQSVTVVTRQRLDDLGVDSLNEVLERTPGVYRTNNDTERTRFYSRGYAINNYLVDGVLMPQGGPYVSLNSDAAVYDRLEVVRGATGMMTGAGDPSGSVSLMRKRPTRDFQATVAGQIGRWDSWRSEFDVGGPVALDGRLRARLVGVKQAEDSFRDRYQLDKEVLYGVAEFDLTDRTLITLGYDYQAPITTGVTWGTVPYWMADGRKANLPRSTNWAPGWSEWSVQQKQLFSSLEHDFGYGWNLKLSYVDDTKEFGGARWFGGGGYPAADGTGMRAWRSNADQEMDTTTVDVQVNGAFALFGRDHELVFGYARTDSKRNVPFLVRDPVPDGYTTIEDWRTFDGRFPQFTVTDLGFDANRYRTKQSAGFATARFSVIDPLHVTVGARLSDWDYSARSYDENGELEERSAYGVDRELTPYLGVTYDLSDQLTVYASYTSIFKPQDYQDMNGDFLDPVVGDNTELGLKSSLFEDRLTLSVAAFRGEQDNLAERDDTRDLKPGSFDPDNPPEGYDENGHFQLPGGRLPYRSTGKGSEVSGVELEAQGDITANWNLSFGFTHTKVEDADGNTLQSNRPRNLLRVFSGYRFPGQWNRLSVGGGVTWQSKIWDDANRPTGEFNDNGSPVTESARITQSDFYLVDAMAQYRWLDNLSTSLHVYNLLDEAYYRNVGFYNGVHWGEPRSWNLKLRYQF
ncbi:TonB-dependent siderophore receptor [Marinobacter xestospongiae]|uniref:TonB-dependent siderophore receptor n=1 Tax=Marinobacter xestospongiae TaxID=994319 RepID=A0ABU3VZD9_9GAMM|nr:TonB-dependent siderophore receptor [Marinobacter xestospongiae]MDV2079531.1 TonB-dependent siderophore receptor [Marinobacter xestospongiae]